MERWIKLPNCNFLLEPLPFDIPCNLDHFESDLLDMRRIFLLSGELEHRYEYDEFFSKLVIHGVLLGKFLQALNDAKEISCFCCKNRFLRKHLIDLEEAVYKQVSWNYNFYDPDFEEHRCKDQYPKLLSWSSSWATP